MIEIYLIVTEGCKSCSIAENIISRTTDNDLYVIDHKEVPDWIKSNIVLKDFPITIILKDNIIKEVLYGTFNTSKLKKVISNLS